MDQWYGGNGREGSYLIVLIELPAKRNADVFMGGLFVRSLPFVESFMLSSHHGATYTECSDGITAKPRGRLASLLSASELGADMHEYQASTISTTASSVSIHTRIGAMAARQMRAHRLP